MRCSQSRLQHNKGRNPLSDSPKTVQINRASSLAIDAVEADIVRNVFQLALTGTGSSGPMGVRNIAQHLNAAGHRTRAGGEFYSSTIHEMLIREAYAGTRSWNVFDKNGNQNPDDQIIDYEVPAILDRETFDAVQSRLGERQPRQRGPRLDSAPCLFGGLIRCGCCGGAMSPSTGTGRKGVVYRYYKCASSINKGTNACHLKPISRDVAEQRVMAELINWLVVPGRLAAILTALHARKTSRQASVHQRIADLQRDASETEKSLANLYRAIEGGILDPAEPTLQGRVQELSAKRDLARNALERAQAHLVEAPVIDATVVETFAKELVARLVDGSVEARKAWLSAIVDAIIVEPGSIRLIGRNDNFERTLRTTPRGAAWFAVLIGSGGPDQTNLRTHTRLKSLCDQWVQHHSSDVRPLYRRKLPSPPQAMPPMQTYFVSRNSSMPYFEPSRPSPESLTPPNGASAVDIRPVLTPTIPYSSASATRNTLATSCA